MKTSDSQAIFAIFDKNEEDIKFYLEDFKYYFDAFQPSAFAVLKAARDAEDAETMVRRANSIWFALPDDRSIRRHGFFRLCDIAEYVFEEDEPE